MVDTPPHSAGTPASPVIGTKIVGSHHVCGYQAPSRALSFPAPNPSLARGLVRKHVPDSDPGWAIGTKACPGLRSGIDRSGSLSFAIRGIPSSTRPPIRHSGEGRNPEGVGRGGTPYDRQQPAAPHLHLRDVASAKPAAGPALLLASNCTETMAPTCFTRHNRAIRIG